MTPSPRPATAVMPVPPGMVASLFATMCATALLSQVMRSSMGVLAPDLMKELALSPETFGVLSGILFLVHALVQVPFGILFDRIGTRALVLAGVLVMAVAALIFATATSTAALFLARILMGIGGAPLIVGSYVVFLQWLTPARYTPATSVLAAVGNLGTLLATAPLALAAALLGWRGAFYAIAALAVVVFIAAWSFVHNTPPGREPPAGPRESLSASLSGLRAVVANRNLHRVIGFAVVGYPAVITVMGLWGGPYLHDVHGLDTVMRGNVLLGIIVGFMASALVFGWLATRWGARRAVLFGAVLLAGDFLALALVPAMPLPGAVLLLIGVGLAGGCVVLMLPIARLLVPPHLAGRALTTVNIAIVGGGAIWQALAGLVIGAFAATDGSAPEIAYRVAFAMLALVVVAGALAFRRLPDLDGKRLAAPGGGPQ